MKKKTNRFDLLKSKEVYSLFKDILKNGESSFNDIITTTGKKKAVISLQLKPLEEAYLINHTDGVKGKPATYMASKKALYIFISDKLPINQKTFDTLINNCGFLFFEAKNFIELIQKIDVFIDQGFIYNKPRPIFKALWKHSVGKKDNNSQQSSEKIEV